MSRVLCGKVESRRGALVVVVVDQVLLWMAWALVSVEMELRNTNMNAEGLVLSVLTTVSCTASALTAVGAGMRPKSAKLLLSASALFRLLHIALNVYYFKLGVRGVFRLAFLPSYVPFALIATLWAVMWILWDVYWMYQVVGFENLQFFQSNPPPIPEFDAVTSSLLRQRSNQCPNIQIA